MGVNPVGGRQTPTAVVEKIEIVFDDRRQGLSTAVGVEQLQIPTAVVEKIEIVLMTADRA